MNTTSLTFRRPLIYTVLSDSAGHSEAGSFSIAILPRGNAPMISLLVDEVSKLHPQEVLLFNNRFLRQFKQLITVRNIVTEQDLSLGEMVNIAIEECKTDFVFVLWSDTKIDASSLSVNLFNRIRERSDLCTIPQLQSNDGELLSCVTSPVFDSSGFGILRNNEPNTIQKGSELKVFLPTDYVGIYNRMQFLNLGGYDTSIANDYWQKVDFALRAAMWGERIVLNSALVATYAQDEELKDDERFDISSRIFALKSLGVKLDRHGHAYLPLNRILWLLTDGRQAFKLFKELRAWVSLNRYRFKYSAEDIVDHWLNF